MLISNAIKDSRMENFENYLLPVGDYIAGNTSKNGGIPFGIDFWYAPDVD
jgi:hypothetical protein